MKCGIIFANASLVKIDWSLGNWDLWFLVWSKRFCHTHSHSCGVTNSRILPSSGHFYCSIARHSVKSKFRNMYVGINLYHIEPCKLLPFVTKKHNPKNERTMSSLKIFYRIPGFPFTTRLLNGGTKYLSRDKNWRDLQNEQEDFSFVSSVL